MDGNKPNAVAVFITTFLFCFLFWMALVASVAPRELILGVIVAAAVALFTGKFFIHHSAFYFFNPVRIVLLVLYCCVIFLFEVIKANLSMAAMVLSPSLKSYKPGIIRIPAGEAPRSEYGQAMVANSITLTPGTITMDVAEDESGKSYYYIHWANTETTDREKAGESIKGRMERWIGRIWK